MDEVVTLPCKSGDTISLLPIAYLLPHEQHDPGHAALLAQAINASETWTAPILVEQHHSIILDGHHRVEAAKQLKLAAIPAVLIAYDNPRLSLVSWRPGENWTPNDVICRALEGLLFPPKTTRHQMRPPLEAIALPLSHLRIDQGTEKQTGTASGSRKKASSRGGIFLFSAANAELR